MAMLMNFFKLGASKVMEADLKKAGKLPDEDEGGS